MGAYLRVEAYSNVGAFFDFTSNSRKWNIGNLVYITICKYFLWYSKITAILTMDYTQMLLLILTLFEKIKISSNFIGLQNGSFYLKVASYLLNYSYLGWTLIQWGC